MRIKISGKGIQLAAKAVSKNAPLVMSKVSKVVTPVLTKAEAFVRPAVEVIKRNPEKFATGAVGAVLAADNIHQRHKFNVLKRENAKREVETKEALQKHEAEIVALKVMADKAENLEILNEQLCNVIKQTKKGEVDEEVHEDGTTD